MNDNWSGEIPPFLEAARFGPPSLLRRRLRSASDVDLMWWGRTALWEAVANRQEKSAVALFEAGADPWRVMIGGWSPGRLSLAGPTPDLFGTPPQGAKLSRDEKQAVSRAQRLIPIVDPVETEGGSVACIAGIDAEEAQHRLKATVLRGVDTDKLMEALWELDLDDSVREAMVGVTDVPGGCVVAQWEYFAASTPGVMARLTPGTVGYGMYGNPASGNQGTLFADGAVLGWDLHPGSPDVVPDASAEETLRAYLYGGHPLAYCCDVAGLRLKDARAFTGPPDRWLRLPKMSLYPRRRASRSSR